MDQRRLIADIGFNLIYRNGQYEIGNVEIDYVGILGDLSYVFYHGNYRWQERFFF